MVNQGQLTMYRDCTPVIDEKCETGSKGSIVDALTTALARAEGTDVTDLPPLYEEIDLGGVKTILDRYDETTDPETTIAFTFDMWNVFVREDGHIRVCDGTTPTDPTPVFNDSVE